LNHVRYKARKWRQPLGIQLPVEHDRVVPQRPKRIVTREPPQRDRDGRDDAGREEENRHCAAANEQREHETGRGENRLLGEEQRGAERDAGGEQLHTATARRVALVRADHPQNGGDQTQHRRDIGPELEHRLEKLT
jgi:hypothetical protein